MTKQSIAIDAMGGDFGPSITVPASLDALEKHLDLHIILVGNQVKIERFLKKYKSLGHSRISIKNTSEIVKRSGFPAIIAGLFLSLSFVAYIVAMSKTTVANVVFIISTQTIFLAIFGLLFLKEKITFKGFASITLAFIGMAVMIGDSINQGTLFGNIVAFAIPINFTILVMIIRKFPDLDMIPAIFYSGIFSGIYGLFLASNLMFSANDVLMGFLLGVPQLAFGFICVTIGTRTTKAVTVGLLMLLETIFAPIWVWIFLNEVPPISVFTGGAIIIFAVIFKSFDKSAEINN